MPETPSWLGLPHAEDVPGTLIRRKGNGEVGGVGPQMFGGFIATEDAIWGGLSIGVAITPPVLNGAGLGGAAPANQFRCFPTYLHAGLAISQLGVYSPVGGATLLRFSLYDSLASLYPGNLLIATGDVNAAAGGGVFGAAVYTVPVSGWYFIAYQSSASTGLQVWGGETIEGRPFGYSGAGVPHAGLTGVLAYGAAAPDPAPAGLTFYSVTTHITILAKTTVPVP